MADPSPLLNDLEYAAVPVLRLDSTIEKCIGKSGRSQLLQALLISGAWFFDAQQTFISVFADASPSWHCIDAGNCSSTAAARCNLPDFAWSWDRPAHSSSVSEWGLDCSSSSAAGLPSSAFFAGCLVGGLLLATLADSSFGRKKMLYLTCLGMSIAGLITPLSPNIWVYAVLRFMAGFFRATIITSSLVLATEVVSKRWQDKVGLVGFFTFTAGFLSLPAMAYAGRNMSWRYLYVWTSLPSLIYSFTIWAFAHESPRWLIVRGRREEAIQTLKDIFAASNGYTIMSSFSTLPVFDEEMVGGGADLYSALKLLVSRRWSLRRLAAVMCAGVGIGLVYYGMPLAVGDLGFDLYMSVAVNALAELPASLMTAVLVDRINRKSSLIAFTLASGVLSGACVLLSGGSGSGSALFVWGRMGAEVGSFFAACTSFNVIMIYTLELFPTCVRNSALSMVRQALVLGGVLAPQLVAAGRGRAGGSGLLPFGVFGLLIACLGLLTITLPETRGEGICDTMEEQEYKAASHQNQKAAAAIAANTSESESDGDDSIP